MRKTIWYPLFNGVLMLGFMLVLSGCLPGWNDAMPNTESIEETMEETFIGEELVPPIWLHGNWISGTDGEYQVKFTGSSVIVTATGAETDYGQLFMGSSPEIADQQSSETHFAFVVQPSSDVNGVTVMFTRIDNNSIRHTIQLNPEMFVGPIILYRPGFEPTFTPPAPPADEPPPPPPPADEPPPPPPPADEPPVEDPPSTPEETAGILNPPLWIMGEWQTSVDGEYDVLFTDNSLIVTALDFPLDYGKLYADAGAELIEEISDELYKFEVNSPDGSLDETFIFVKLSNSSIMHTIEKEGGISIGPVTLFRPTEDLPPIDPPVIDPPPADPPVEEPAGCEDFQVDINSAEAEDLRRIIHVGDGIITTDAVIAARPFSSVDDLMNITGFTAAHLSDIKDQNVACAA